MVLPSCLLDDGHWVGQIGLFAADPMNFCDHALEHGGTWALAFPWGSIISGFWILDSLPSDIRRLIHFFSHFLLRCAVSYFHCILHFVAIIMCAAFTRLCFPAFYVLCSAGLTYTFAGLTFYLCRDDMHFCILIALQFSLEAPYYVLCDGIL